MIDYFKILSPEYTKLYNKFKHDRLNSHYENIGELSKSQPQKDLNFIISSEKNYHAELRKLAIEYVIKEFPIIKLFEPTININFVSEIDLDESNDTSKITSNDNPLIKDIQKQKLINGIIQGAAYVTNDIHYIITELEKYGTADRYKSLFKFTDFIYYNTDSKILESQALKQSKQKKVAGKSKLTVIGGEPYFYIESTCLVNSIHEIVKALYGYISLNAYKSEKTYYDVTKFTDSISDEIEDIKHGTFIYSSMKNYMIDNHLHYYDKSKYFFEVFFTELCKLDSLSFIKIINDIILNKPNRIIEDMCKETIYKIKEYEIELFDEN